MTPFDYDAYMLDFERRNGAAPAAELPAGFMLDEPEPAALPEGFSLDAPAAPAAELPEGFSLDAQPAEQGPLDRYLLNPLGRGKNQILDQSLNAAGLLTGIMSPEEFAHSAIRDQKEAESYPRDPRDAATLDAIQKAQPAPDTDPTLIEQVLDYVPAAASPALMFKRVYDNAGAIPTMLDEATDNPGALVGLAVESAPAIPASVAGLAVGAAAGTAVAPGVGTVVGGGVGSGVASGATEFLTAMTEFMREKGLASDEATLAAAVQDPAILAEAKTYAAKRGIAVGVFDALAAGLAGKVAGPVGRTLAGGGVAGRVAGVGAEAGVQSATGAAGEAAAQVATDGEVKNPGAVFLEAAAEVPGSALEVPAAVLAREAGAKVAPKAATETKLPEGFTLDTETTPEISPAVAPAGDGADVGRAADPAVPAGADAVAVSVPDPSPAPDPVDPAVPVEPVAPAGTVEPLPVEPAAQVEPAPAPAPVQTPAAPQRERVTTPDGEFETDVEFQVVEADSLKAAQGDLQPRDRAARVGSDIQVQQMAARLDPLRLMGSRESDRGAPIIDEDDTILSGNGRTAAIIAAMKNNPERYQSYRASLDQAGFKTEGFKNPILVRRAVGIAPENKRRFATRSNSDGGLGLSPTERAGIEQDYVSADMLARFDTEVEGGVSAASNGEFVRSFLRRVPTNEQASFVNTEGQLTPLGAQRIAGAIFARAYGDKSLVERFVEDEKDPAIRNALTGAAAAWAHMRDAVKDTPLDITPDLVQAVALINRAKTAGMTIANFTAQQDAFNQTPKRVQDLSRLFFNHTGNKLAAWRDIRDRLRSYAEQAARTANADGDIFGGPAPTPESILQGVTAGIDRKAGPQAATPTPTNGGELFAGRETLSRAPMRGGKGAERQLAAGASTKSGPLLDAAETVDTNSDLDVIEDADDATRAPRGSLTPKTEAVSFTNRASMYEEAFRVAGLTPDEGRLLKPEQRKAVLKRVLEQTFGFKVDLDVKRAKIGVQDAVDQMLDAYRNIRFMMHTLQLPLKGVSLDGSLTLALEQFKGRYFGAYVPATRTIHMPGRSNSFAHEWMHALDHFLLERLKPNTAGVLLSQATRNEGLDPTVSVEAAFVNLVHAMFFDQADVALKVMRLETLAAETIQKGPKAGQPTQAALTAQDQIERLASGATRLRIKPSKFRQDSADYSPVSAGYFASVHEMLARTFEAYVANRVEAAGGGNEFITKGEANYLGDADRRLAMTFPKADERLRIFAAFDDVLHHLRTAQVLGTDAAADRPDDVDVIDPQHWNKLVLAMDEPGLLKQIANEAMSARNLLKRPTVAGLKAGVSSLAQGAGFNTSQPASATLREAGKNVADVSRRFLGSARGVMKAINKRNDGKGGSFLTHVNDHLATDPGTGKAQARTYEEQRERGTLQAADEIESILKANGFGLKLPQFSNDSIRELLFGEKVANATADMRAVAAALRRLLDKTHRAATAAGINVGYVSDTGYLPRVILGHKVEKDPLGFVRDATKLYKSVYDRITAGIGPEDMLGLATATSNRAAPTTDARRDGPYAAQLKALRASLRAAEKAVDEARANPQDKALKQAATDAVKTMQADLDALKAAVRDDYAQIAAEDWKGRVLIGDSATYDSHGPDSSFTKERTLPPEADQIMAGWYDTDVLNLALGYVHRAHARIAYQQRFGNPSGAKKLDDVLRRQDARDAIRMNPKKYAQDTEAGRLNILRDLANPRTDNVLEMALWEAQAHGAEAADVVTVRGIVEDFTGRKQRSPLSDVGDAVSGLVYVLTYVTLLPKAAFTAVSEPLTVMMRTGSLKAAGVTFGAYMMEAVRAAKTTKERAALARAIGLVSTPLFDMVLMNRLSGDFGHVMSGNTILSRFFRANGLSQLTNAQRRAVMAGGFYWLRDMAQVALDPKKDSTAQRIAKAEFSDLGVPAEHMDSLLDWIAQHDEHPTLDELETPAGRLYMDAIARYVDQTIQNPRRADKPLASASPLGRMAYALTSYLYTFFRNVHLASLNRAVRNYGIAREEGASKASAALEASLSPLGTLAGGFALMFAGQLIVTTAREALFNAEQWEEKDEDERREWLWKLALSRTGIAGPSDIIFNALTGLRYERDLANLAIGPGLSYYFSQVQNVLLGIPGLNDRNSPRTNTTERTAAKSLYRLTIAPAASIGLSALNAYGPISWTGRYLGLTALTSNSAADKFADVLIGPPDKK